jgi:tryptophanyl-tRNA synthetase
MICCGTKSTPNTIEINKVTHIKTYSHSKDNKVRQRNIYTNFREGCLGDKRFKHQIKKKKKKCWKVGTLFTMDRVPNK